MVDQIKSSQSIKNQKNIEIKESTICFLERIYRILRSV
jgi:hypothetical protein